MTYGNILLASTPLSPLSGLGLFLDLSTKFGAQVQVKVVAGAAVFSTNGLSVVVSRATSSMTDTVPLLSFLIPMVVGTEQEKSFELQMGQYLITLTNLDPNNSVTVDIIYDTFDAVN